MKRKCWLIAMVLFWIAAVVIADNVLWQRDFGWSEFLVLGLMLVAALSMTVAWWMFERRQNGLGSTTADATAL